MRRSLRLPTLVVFLLLCGNAAEAQQPDVRPYESEEDLWEALRENEITFEEFLDLLDLIRVGVDVLPASDLEQLPGADAGYLTEADQTPTLPDVALDAPDDNRPGLRWTARTGYDADLVTPTGGDPYAIIHARYRDNWRGMVDLEHEDNEITTRRALLTYQPRHWRVALGSVEPRWGRGLVIGRRDRFIDNSRARPLSSFTRARFSGFLLDYGTERALSASLLLSRLGNGEFTDRVAGVRVSYGRPLWRVGIASMVGFIEKRDTLPSNNDESIDNASPEFRSSVTGIHLHVGNSRRAILAEVARTDDDALAHAAEAIYEFTDGRLHARAWSYDTDFINPWGGGPAHADRESVLLDSIDESYSTRATGERGFSVSTKVTASRSTRVQWDWMTHRESPTAPPIHHWTVRARIRQGGTRITPFARGKSEEGGDDLYAIGCYFVRGTTDDRFEARAEVGRHRAAADPYLRLGLGLRRRLNAHVRFAPTVRWVDPDLETSGDAYWYFYLTETVFPGTDGHIEAAVVYQRYEDRSREDRIELRLRLRLEN